MLFLKKEQLHRSIIMSLMLLTLLLKSTSPRRKSRKIINVIYQKVQLMVNATLPFVPHSTAFWPLAPKSRFEKKVLENLMYLCNFQWVSFTYSLFLSAICPLLRRCMSVILFAVMDSLSLIFFQWHALMHLWVANPVKYHFRRAWYQDPDLIYFKGSDSDLFLVWRFVKLEFQ